MQSSFMHEPPWVPCKCHQHCDFLAHTHRILSIPLKAHASGRNMTHHSSMGLRADAQGAMCVLQDTRCVSNPSLKPSKPSSPSSLLSLHIYQPSG